MLSGREANDTRARTRRKATDYNVVHSLQACTLILLDADIMAAARQFRSSSSIESEAMHSIDEATYSLSSSTPSDFGSTRQLSPLRIAYGRRADSRISLRAFKATYEKTTSRLLGSPDRGSGTRSKPTWTR